jgi:hypothetical protein
MSTVTLQYYFAVKCIYLSILLVIDLPLSILWSCEMQ